MWGEERSDEPYPMFLTENGNLVMAVFDFFSVKVIYKVYNPWSFKL